MINIECLGGFKEVGRNAVFINNEDKIMLEYGMNVESNDSPILPSQKPNNVFITHGHLDHLGSVPLLFKKGDARLFATSITWELGILLLKDSLKVAGYKGIRRLYSERDIRRCDAQYHEIRYNKPIKFHGTTITPFDAGHLPGSACFLVETGKKKILYTGDFKMKPTELTDGMKLPNTKIDALFMETTYSAHDHPSREETEKKFFHTVKKTIDSGGIALIPSFALRAPEIMLVLNKFNVDFPVYLDGMAVAATEIAMKHPSYLKNSIKLRQAYDLVNRIKRNTKRNQVITKPCAIITTGGCMDGGPVVEYIKHLYTDEKSSLILTGFQIPKTAGRYLLDTGRYVVNDMDLKVRMPIHFFDFSGHAGRNELMDLVKDLRPEKVICMHGDNCQRFATELKNRFGVDAIAPTNGEILKI